jgi:hypothetical protein
VPLVQKGKVEEAILESLPQLLIQLLNTALLDQLGNMPLLTTFSISLSVLSITSTIWYYAYWSLFLCTSIRHVPSSLAIYIYKLSGVIDGPLSFAKARNEIAGIGGLDSLELPRISATCKQEEHIDVLLLNLDESKGSCEHSASKS